MSQMLASACVATHLYERRGSWALRSAQCGDQQDETETTGHDALGCSLAAGRAAVLDVHLTKDIAKRYHRHLETYIDGKWFG